MLALAWPAVHTGAARAGSIISLEDAYMGKANTEEGLVHLLGSHQGNI